MKTCPVSTAALLTMLTLGPATADDGAPQVPGALLRVTAPTISPAPLIGTLVDSNERELTLIGSQAGKRTIPRDAITKVEWSSGRRSQAGSFAKKGAIAGGAVFAIALALVNNDDSGERAAGAAVGAGSGALWGGLIGALIGASKHTYDWKEGSVPGHQVSLRPAIVPGSRAGVSIAIRW